MDQLWGMRERRVKGDLVLSWATGGGELPFMSPEDLGKTRWGESPGGWLRPESGGAANGRWL